MKKLTNLILIDWYKEHIKNNTLIPNSIENVNKQIEKYINYYELDIINYLFGYTYLTYINDNLYQVSQNNNIFYISRKCKINVNNVNNEFSIIFH